MTDSLWRDDYYEPASLPSAAELLHPELALSTPTAAGEARAPGAPLPPATFDPNGEPIEQELTRFLPRRRPGRYIVATVVTAGVICTIALVVALMTGAEGPIGVGLFFATIGTVLVGIVAIVWVWRWAGKRRRGVPYARG